MDLYSQNFLVIPVAIAEGQHLFPFRTEQLSPPAPMVLLGTLSGRVGRCRVYYIRPIIFKKWWALFCGDIFCGKWDRWALLAMQLSGNSQCFP